MLSSLIKQTVNLTKPFFHLNNKLFTTLTANTSQLLQQPIKTLQPVRGMKIKGHVKRRCKDCYLVMREGRLYNMCKTFGRHKQMSLVRHEKYTWMLSHATQGKIRPW